MEPTKKIKIRMVCGTYGYREPNGVMEAKNNKSAPFEVEEKEGERLIRMGYAVKVRDGAMPEEACGGGEPENGETGSIAEELGEMTKKDLEKVAKDMGIPANGTKNELIQRIMEEEESRRENAGGVPELNAAEPEE